MRKLMIGFGLFVLLVVGIPAFAQKENPLAGTWDLVSTTQDGKQVPPSLEGAPAGVKPGVYRRIYTPDGNYMHVQVSKGRPIPKTTPRNQWTKEDLLAHYWGTNAQFGTYSISGDKLIHKVIAALNAPTAEGQDRVYLFLMDGADLIIASTGTGPKVEIRYRRVK
jgi:hypothetical protein